MFFYDFKKVKKKIKLFIWLFYNFVIIHNIIHTHNNVMWDWH